ncbi:hypothetical protein FQA39_LY17896 [Lamprigera yunnana]|nr:hypothetical protein FQA39_LY17896 [Lamprigera yunnana]
MDISNLTPDIFVENDTEFLQQLQRNEVWESIPFLNYTDVQNLQDKRLVKFQGMIQDMFNPEYFYEKYEVIDRDSEQTAIRNGKFTDIIYFKDTETINETSDKNVTNERHTLVMISIPGLNQWVIDMVKARYGILKQIEPFQSSTSKKRLLEPDEQMETQPIESGKLEMKKQCVGEAKSNVKNISRETILNFPLPSHDGKACHVKLYKDADKVKLNDVIEVVGFLSVDPVLTDISCNENFGNEMEVQMHNPPPSLIPRIHCVAFKKISHGIPLVENNILNLDRIQNAKKNLHLVLTQLLMGDVLAAEYLMYHLISRVYMRNELLSLGKFTLNISNVPVKYVPNFARNLSDFIELMVPTSHYVALSLENFNTVEFIPKKDYECDRLTSGLLQLSENTHLILDETKLTTGRLTEKGLKAYNALSDAIKFQKITYDFNYYPVEFNCDIAFLVISEKNATLPSDCHIALQPDNDSIETYSEILAAAKVFLKNDVLNDIRMYLSQSRYRNFELNDDVHKFIENEFVQMRKSQNITGDDLHQLLVLVRWIGLSEGKSKLDEDSWKRARHIEEERKNRLS